jgi:hypothetical protein
MSNYFIPYEKYVITSKMSTGNVCNAIDGTFHSFKLMDLGTKASFPNIFDLSDGYEGSRDGFEFEITRVSPLFRNAFRPTIKGVINQGIKTEIEITMKMNIIVYILMGIWLVGILTVFIFTLINQINTSRFELSPLIDCLFLLIFGYGFCLGLFKFESYISKSFLSTLFQAEENQSKHN